MAGVRWLLVKDLQILRRSPLLVALLVAYPILVSVLIGFALSGGPDKPKVAFVNQARAETVSVGGEEIDVSQYAGEFFDSVDPIPVDTREEALEKIRSGEALGAVIVPPDITDRLQATLGLAGIGERPTLEVIYNVEDPVKGRFVEQTIKARLADANQALSGRLTQEGARYLDILLRGGRVSFPLVGSIDVLGLERAQQTLQRVARTLPEGSERRQEVERVARFAQLAVENLDVSDEILAAIRQPIAVKRTVLEGGDTPLDAFAVAVSVALSLMFVCVLLAAGTLALEREEHAYGRLVRGLVSRTGLLVEKVVLAAGCASVVGLLMLGLLSPFLGLDWGRFPLWLAAIVAGAVGFAALGIAIGAAAREVRAASLLAFLLALPVAFLALVPSGTVSPALFDVIQVVSAAFPFEPALDALDVALNDTDGSFLGALGHLAGLTVAYTAVARVGLRRFG